MVDYKKEYDQLINSRTEYSNCLDIIKMLKTNIWQYFTSNNCINDNINQNIMKPMGLYVAPVYKVHRSKMVNWPLKHGSEIYVDNDFIEENKEDPKLVMCQITHEAIHGITRKVDDKNNNYLFGHVNIVNKNGIDYTAINEACTQIVAEEINGIIIEKDVYYSLKTIIRIIMLIIGKKEMLDQFCNSNTIFEEKFNSITNNRFNDFAKVMETILNLSKRMRNGKIDSEKQLIENQINNYIKHTLKFIKNAFNEELIKKPEIYDEFNKIYDGKFTLEELFSKENILTAKKDSYDNIKYRR